MAHAYRAVGWNRQKRIYDAVLLTGVALYLGVFIGVAAALDPRATPETLLIRATGTCALLLLHVVLSIGPLARLDRRFLPLLYNRRHLGVTMFALAAAHGLLALVQFHGFGDVDPLVSLLAGHGRWDELAHVPFQPLGAAAAVILFLMAATSHDFWLANLTAPAWKALHMLVYLAYALIVLHVTLGVLQAETHPALAAVLALGVAWVLGLHLVAGWREARGDREATGRPEAKPGSGDAGDWIDAGPVGDIPEGRARVVTVCGERVAVFRWEGKVAAVSNACQHQNGPLGEGRIVDGLITCPWHGYQYLPACGRSPPPFTEAVPTFRTDVRDGRVRLDRTPLPAGTDVPPSAADGAGPSPGDGEAYVGYLSAAPAALARWLRPRVALLLLVAVGAAATLAAAQGPFAWSAFEFGETRSFEGVLEARPHPTLVVPRPGRGAEASRYLLTVFGKRGADARVAGLEGRRVRLSGSLIHRDGDAMIELSDGPIEDLGEARAGAEGGLPSPRDLGRHVFVGEIVDSKCFLGVMKPGNLKPHRACAERCISGGVPPLLLVTGEDGRTLHLLLVDEAGGAVNERVLDLVAEPVAIEGRLVAHGDRLVLHADPAGYRRVPGAR